MNILRFINSRKYKNNKFVYYLKGTIRYYTPKFILKNRLAYILSQLNNQNKKYVEDRINYYNKLSGHNKIYEDAPSHVGSAPSHIRSEFSRIANFKLPLWKRNHSSFSTYFFDTQEYLRYFPKQLKFVFIFGDVNHVPDAPSIVKSRPVEMGNSNSILLNLDKARHFVFVKDKIKFEDKQNKLIGRAFIYQPHRIKFWEMYFGHPLCNLGQTNKSDTTHPEWSVKPMTIDEHLSYKFILCLEGNDVATNLKWVMSSNSLAVMPRPRYETWFMEGRLKPNYHYVEIKPDYSDLEERINYYIRRTAHT